MLKNRLILFDAPSTFCQKNLLTKRDRKNSLAQLLITILILQKDYCLNLSVRRIYQDKQQFFFFPRKRKLTIKSPMIARPFSDIFLVINQT